MKMIIPALAAATALLSFAPLAQADDFYPRHRTSSGVVVVLGDHRHDRDWYRHRYANRDDYYRHRAYYYHHHPRWHDNGWHNGWRDDDR